MTVAVENLFNTVHYKILVGEIFGGFREMNLNSLKYFSQPLASSIKRIPCDTGIWQYAICRFPN